MYLPTFWKLKMEQTAHLSGRIVGYALPVGCMSKSLSKLLASVQTPSSSSVNIYIDRVCANSAGFKSDTLSVLVCVILFQLQILTTCFMFSRLDRFPILL